jgi:CheY-like chemotaxis protein
VTGPRILALTNDLFFLPRLEDASTQLGFTLDRLDFAPSQGETPPRPVPLTEPLEGDEAMLVRSLVADPPALILIDLASEGIPWPRWIQVLKTSSATRRIPVLAFGPHVEEAALDQARRLGADLVVTRGQLQANLPELLRRETRPPDTAAILAGCSRPASAEAGLGIAALRSGRYFEAHEHLERAVLDDPGVDATVYRALLHLAVACLHTERGNWRGAQKMLLRMRPWLAVLPEQCRGVEVTSLRSALESLQALLDRWQESGQAPPSPLSPPEIVVRDLKDGRPAQV